MISSHSKDFSLVKVALRWQLAASAVVLFLGLRKPLWKKRTRSVNRARMFKINTKQTGATLLRQYQH